MSHKKLIYKISNNSLGMMLVFLFYISAVLALDKTESDVLKTAFSVSCCAKLDFADKKSDHSIQITLSEKGFPVFSVHQKIHIYSPVSKRLVNTFVSGEFPFFHGQGKNLFFLKDNKLYYRKFDLKNPKIYSQKKKLLHLNFTRIVYCNDLCLAAAVTEAKELVLLKIDFSSTRPRADVIKTNIMNASFPFISESVQWPLLYVDENSRIRSCKIKSKPFTNKGLMDFLGRFPGYRLVSISPDSSLGILFSIFGDKPALIVNPGIESSGKLETLVTQNGGALFSPPFSCIWDRIDPVLWLVTKRGLFSITYTGSLSFRNTSIKKLVNTVGTKVKKDNKKRGVDLIEWNENQLRPAKKTYLDVNNNNLPSLDANPVRKKKFLYIAGPAFIESSFYKRMLWIFINQHRF